MSMKRFAVSALVACHWVVASPGWSAIPSSGGAAVGSPSLDLRLRSEHVHQSNDLEDAKAATLRARLGYETPRWRGLQATLEYASVAHLGNDAYNNLRDDRGSGRSVIADPDGARVNRAQLSFSGIPGLIVGIGRQRLIYDNARFVGNVGWRQNEQTFDAVQLRTELVPDTTLSYAYLHRVNGILFSGSRMQGHLLNAHYAPLPQLAVTAYGYWLDFREDRPADADRRTLGLRASGSFDGAVPLHYALEYARQHDHADAAALDAAYWLAELRTETGPLSWTVGYEVLGGDGATGFQTPLATLHAFQGWADVFLVTPVDGVRDLNVALSGVIAKTRWQAGWHRFSADSGGADYGREWNLMVSRSLADALSLSLKYAEYRARAFGASTRKFWVSTEYRF